MSKPKSPQPLLLVVRIRGTLNVRRDMKSTLESLRVRKIHSATLLRHRPDVLGALQQVKDLVTWGEIDEATLVKLLERRARLVGDRAVTEQYLVNKLNARDFPTLAKSLINYEMDLTDLPGVKPFFRLSPPKKGYGLKLDRSRKGKVRISGYVGKAINEFALRMI